MTPDELKAALEQLLPGVALAVEGPAVSVPADNLLSVCRALKGTERFACDYVANLTAVDYPAEKRLDVVYHLGSMSKKTPPLLIKVKLPREEPELSSVTGIWRGAELQEREVYDLYGVNFIGHPDLRRILMWDGFQGHPMRKDYVPEDQDAPEASPA